MKKIYTDEQIVGFVRKPRNQKRRLVNFVGKRDLTKARFISGKNASVRCRFRKSKDCANWKRRMPGSNVFASFSIKPRFEFLFKKRLPPELTWREELREASNQLNDIRAISARVE